MSSLQPKNSKTEREKDIFLKRHEGAMGCAQSRKSTSLPTNQYNVTNDPALDPRIRKFMQQAVALEEKKKEVTQVVFRMR